MGGPTEISNALILTMAALAIGLVVFPGPLADFVRTADGEKERPFLSVNNFLQWVYLTSFGTTFGATLWASFIGGIITFKHLPRHQFGNLQSHLFPALFKLNSICLSSMVSIFAVLHPFGSASLWEKAQFPALGLSLVFNLVNLVFLEPKTTKLMRERHKAEREDGISTEPGVDRKKEIEKASPKLRAINKKFFALHGISSLINLFAFWGQFAHVFYMGGRMAM